MLLQSNWKKINFFGLKKKVIEIVRADEQKKNSIIFNWSAIFIIYL